MQENSLISRSGYRLKFDSYPAQQAPQNSLLVLLPAMGVKASFYRPLASDLAELGYDCWVMELRGQGRCELRASRNCDFGYNDIIENDMTSLLEHAKAQMPKHSISLVGHSIGGHLGLYFLARYPNSAQQLLTIAAGSPYFRGCDKGWRLYLTSLLFTAYGAVLGYFPGHKLGFGGRQGRQLMKDWANLARHNDLRQNNFDYEAAVTKLSTSLRGLVMEGDSFAPFAACQKLLQKSPQPCDIKLLRPEELGVNKLDHFSWAKTGPAMARYISQSIL